MLERRILAWIEWQCVSMNDEIDIEITEDEIRIGDYYLRGRIPDKLAWIIVALVLAALGITHEELLVFVGGF